MDDRKIRAIPLSVVSRLCRAKLPSLAKFRNRTKPLLERFAIYNSLLPTIPINITRSILLSSNVRAPFLALHVHF
jgi:hypothetical protein